VGHAGRDAALLRGSLPLSLLGPLVAKESESVAIPSAIAIASEPSESDDVRVSRCRSSDEPAAATATPLARLPALPAVAVPGVAGAGAGAGTSVGVGGASMIRGTST